MVAALARRRPAGGRPRCSTPRTPACATTTTPACPRSRRRSRALKRAGAAGARMVGGGFGGSVLALLPPGADRRRARRGRAGAAGASSLTASAAASAASARAPRVARSSSSSSPERARERPQQEDRRDDEHRHADPQVEVPAGRLVDLRVGRAEPEDHEDHAVDQEQPADDAAQVEQVRRAARRARRRLGLVLRDGGSPVAVASDMVWLLR